MEIGIMLEGQNGLNWPRFSVISVRIARTAGDEGGG